MWKQLTKHAWLLAVVFLMTVFSFFLFIWSNDTAAGEAYLGSFTALFCLSILLILSLSCLGFRSAPVSGWFRILVMVNGVLSVTVVITNSLDGRKEFSGILYIAETVLFACITVLGWIYWYYIRDEIGKEGSMDAPRLRRGSRLINIVSAVSILLLLVNRMFGMTLYMIDEQGFYQRGRFFPLSWICPIILLISCAVLIFTQHLGRTWKWVHLSYSILPAVMYPMQVMHEKLMPLNISITLALLLMYCINYMNRGKMIAQQKELLAVKEREMLELEIQLMISQIQPHFLYNTIAMIRGLCREDAEAAADSLGYFSAFLRGSLHMMQKKECVTIEEELKLVEAYMFLEQKRFGDRLEYVEDIEDVSFDIPALTIEPLLENAVHHGIEEKEGGGMVLLEVTEDDRNYIVRITDDGAGFDMAIPVDTQKHIGISNVRNRLKQMCDGVLEFTSAPGEGTTAAICIPKKKKTVPGQTGALDQS